MRNSLKSTMGKNIKLNNILILFGFFFILAGLLMIVFNPVIFKFLCYFIEKYLSFSSHMELRIKNKLEKLICIQGIFVILSGLIFLLLRNKNIASKIKYLMKDDCFSSSNNKLSFNLVILISTIGFIITLIYQVFGSLFFGVPGFKNTILKYLYDEDCLFEIITVILLIISIIFLFISILYLIKKYKNKNILKIIAVYFLLAMFFFFFAMEEISWGQRIFQWKTPEYFQKVNIQKETNIHNLYNDKFGIMYKSFSIVLLFVFIFSIYNFKKNIYNLILIHPSMAIIIYLIIFSAFCRQHELTEELVSVMAFFYSYRSMKLSWNESK